MELRELIKDRGISFDRSIDGLEITGITSSSLEVQPGSLFIALKGTVTDGHLFVQSALEHGAAAVIIEDKALQSMVTVPVAVVQSTKDLYWALVQRFYGNPSKDLSVVGITGTNGKTTTAFLLRHIISAYEKVGLIGTIHALIDDAVYPLSNTTPDIQIVTDLMAKMRDQECHSCVMEVSSHALQQDRVRGVAFAVKIFSNLTQDHLDYHGSMEDYYQSKKRLFTEYSAEAMSIVNIDDPYGKRLFDEIAGNKLSYGCTAVADIWADDITAGLDATSMIIHAGDDTYPISVPLACQHNVYNILAAIISAHVLGISFKEGVKTLATFPGVKGRMERVTSNDERPVFVDYAHTPDAMENVLRAVRNIHKGTLVTVFGCGGDRDTGKRPLMGACSVRYSDKVIITNDNPRTESAERIIKDICRGISEAELNEKCMIIPDREKAIKDACALDNGNSIVLILGKGHEDYQIIGTERRYFSDQDVIIEATRN